MNQNERNGPGGTRGYNYKTGDGVKITNFTLPPNNRPEVPIAFTFTIGDRQVEATCPVNELINFVGEHRDWVTHDEIGLAKTGT